MSGYIRATIEPLEWIHYWYKWHWTLSFSWIWSYWLTLGKNKMANISKTRKIFETALTVEITLMDLDKMDIVTWHKFSRFRFVPPLLTDDDDGRLGDPIARSWMWQNVSDSSQQSFMFCTVTRADETIFQCLLDSCELYKACCILFLVG